jgi:hypothetical protein
MVQTISGNDFVRRRRISEDVSAIRAGCCWRRSDLIEDSIAAETAASTALTFLVSEETALADDLGNLRRDHLVPGFVAAGDTLEDVS